VSDVLTKLTTDPLNRLALEGEGSIFNNMMFTALLTKTKGAFRPSWSHLLVDR